MDELFKGLKFIYVVSTGDTVNPLNFASHKNLRFSRFYKKSELARNLTTVKVFLDLFLFFPTPE